MTHIARGALTDGHDLCFEPRLAQLGAVLQGRSFGLIAVKQPGGHDTRCRAVPPTSMCDPCRSLGSVTLVGRRHVVSGQVENWGETESTLLLLGPMGDDHGRVMGALRVLGARNGRATAMLKRHNTDAITMVRLGARAAASMADTYVGSFTPSEFVAYCATLHGKPLNPDLLIEARVGPSFFSRRPMLSCKS